MKESIALVFIRLITLMILVCSLALVTMPIFWVLGIPFNRQFNEWVKVWEVLAFNVSDEDQPIKP